jgi:hypothetical protein
VNPAMSFLIASGWEPAGANVEVSWKDDISAKKFQPGDNKGGDRDGKVKNKVNITSYFELFFPGQNYHRDDTIMTQYAIGFVIK